MKKRTTKAYAVSAAIAIALVAVEARAQVFNSSSTGADGALNITAPGVTNFTQTPMGGGSIYNFTTINIASGSTLRLSGQIFSSPLYFLAQGAATISGTIDLSGAGGQNYGSNPSLRVPSVPGPGGYSGGVGVFGANAAEPGNGPAGGATPVTANCGGGNVTSGQSGGFTGNQFLIPLVGGSGGGGFSSSTGGAGGGAILVASTVSITVSGTINASGGGTGGQSGGGAGGAVRLVSNSISGNGTINVSGANNGECGGGPANGISNGIARLEAFQNSFSGSITGTSSRATPFGLFLPTNGAASVQVVSVGGVPVDTSPTGSFTIPDVTVNSTAPLTAQIQAQNIPLGTIVTLFIWSENGPDQTITATPLGGTLASSSATASVTLPSGFSRGFVQAKWTQ